MKKVLIITSAILILGAVIFGIAKCSGNSGGEGYVRYNYDCLPILSGEKWGFIDTTGAFKVNPQFQNVRVYADGMAAVKAQDDLWGFIDTSGTYSINPTYKEVSDFNEGYAVVVRENSYPEMIRRDGKVVFRFENVSEASVLIEGRARIMREDRYGFVDSTGKVIVSPQFLFAGHFSEGFCNVSQAMNKDTLYGFIDLNGKLIINPQFDFAGKFSEGLSRIRLDDKFGFIDQKGKIVINPQFDAASDFHEGLAEIKLGEQWGYIDNKGKIVINPQFESSNPFYNGLAAVKMTEDKWGYIDKKGKYAINPQFKAAGSFHGPGMAAVRIGEKIGFIDTTGNYLVNPQYDETYLWGFDDILFDFDEENTVRTQYIDIEKLFKSLYGDDTKSLLGIDESYTYGKLKNKHQKDKLKSDGRVVSVDLHEFKYVYDHDIHISNVFYGFLDDLTRRERRFVYSDYYYNYYRNNVVANDGSRIMSIVTNLNLNFGIASGREEEVAKMIIKELEKRIGVKAKKDDSDDLTGYILEKDNYRYFVRYSEEEIPDVVMIGIKFK